MAEAQYDTIARESDDDEEDEPAALPSFAVEEELDADVLDIDAAGLGSTDPAPVPLHHPAAMAKLRQASSPAPPLGASPAAPKQTSAAAGETSPKEVKNGGSAKDVCEPQFTEGLKQLWNTCMNNANTATSASGSAISNVR